MELEYNIAGLLASKDVEKTHVIDEGEIREVNEIRAYIMI